MPVSSGVASVFGHLTATRGTTIVKVSSILIENGTVVSPSGRWAADVLVQGERIAALLQPGARVALGIDADRVIDASNRYVIPGGVDVHTHMQLPMGETRSSDSFETGTVAAAWGGVTTIVDFASQQVGERVLDGLEARHAEADGQCAVDYAFHQTIGGVDRESLAAIPRLVEREGVTSIKLFMAYPGAYYSDDGQILQAMQIAGSLGALTMMHAENGLAIDVLRAQAIARGDTEPVFHGLTRPSVLEGEATNRAVQLARVAGDAPLYIVHLSASEALEEVARARHRGQNVFAETCPQYLWLSLEEHLSRPGIEGAKFVCSTPLRSVHDHHQRDLWTGLRNDDLAVVSTDHCPFCAKDQKDLGIDDFTSIPNGIGGVEHRLELMFQGVVNGEITLERWVETCCTTPARLFGMHPRKGELLPGADADIVIWDPTSKTTIGINGKHHMNMDHSAYEGFVVDGRVETVISRGSILVEHDRFVGRVGHGQFIKRGLAAALR